jgi:hypothetical protein
VGGWVGERGAFNIQEKSWFAQQLLCGEISHNGVKRWDSHDKKQVCKSALSKKRRIEAQYKMVELTD